MSSEELDSPHNLFDLCYDTKWDEMREYVDRSDLSNDVKRQQICWKNKNGLTCFHMACTNKSPIDNILEC